VIDRQDIDALLISALYGELTPADEGRLQAHLESHPTDKTALADLTLARNAVRESRFLTVQLEPPQAISALLLQEASRRARPVPIPQDKSEGWFQRFVRSFAAHPAMAAAAMLVIVIGVAGAMYARNGAQNAERTTETFSDNERAASPALAPAPGAADSNALELQRNAGSGFQAHLAEADAGVAVATGTATVTDQTPRAEPTKAEAKPEPADAKKSAPARTYLQTQTKPPPKPMDLDDRAKGASKADVSGHNEGDEYRVTRKPGAGSAGAPRQAPAAVVVVPRNDPTTNGVQAPKTVGRGGAGGDDASRDGKEKEKVDEETVWARDQHGKVANAVRANNCKEATSLAIALFNRAPAYYNANVESDRALKQCMTYITAEREREVERTQRARAVQRRNADEAKKPSAKMPAPANTDHK
jgi:hypothetical protein